MPVATRLIEWRLARFGKPRPPRKVHSGMECQPAHAGEGHHIEDHVVQALAATMPLTEASHNVASPLKSSRLVIAIATAQGPKC